MKLLLILIVVLAIGAAACFYLWPGIYGSNTPESPTPAASSVSGPAADEQGELDAIPVDDLGKEMADIDAQLAQ